MASKILGRGLDARLRGARQRRRHRTGAGVSCRPSSEGLPCPDCCPISIPTACSNTRSSSPTVRSTTCPGASSGVMRDISSVLKEAYHAPFGDRRARRRDLRHGSGRAPVRERQEDAGAPQRLVQLPLDADPRHGPHPRDAVGAEGAPGLGRARGGVRAGAARRGASRRSAPSGRTWCSRRTSRPPRACCCPTTTCVPWPMPCTRSGGLFVLDCIASGAIWVDMQACGVDVLISAPQKGWSGSPCAAFVMLSERARAAHRCDDEHELRGRPEEVAADHGDLRRSAATPTTRPCRPMRCTLTRDAMLETRRRGFEALRAQQVELGARVRALLASKGLRSVAAEGFQAPGVVVSYTDHDGLHTGQGLHRRRPADRRRRAAAVRRAGRLQDLPHRPVRARQARRHRADGRESRHRAHAHPRRRHVAARGRLRRAAGARAPCGGARRQRGTPHSRRGRSG